MAFYLLFFSGVLGGLLGGMGMGGGTALIPLLTVFLGVEQGVAQGVNLISFLPMSAIALSVHAKNGLLEKGGLKALILPALFGSLIGAIAASRLPSPVLRRAFGVFLTALSVVQLIGILKELRSSEKNFLN